MESIGEFKVADAIADPKSIFSHPIDVLKMKGISDRDKLAILESWRDQARPASNTKELRHDINKAIEKIA